MIPCPSVTGAATNWIWYDQVTDRAWIGRPSHFHALIEPNLPDNCHDLEVSFAVQVVEAFVVAAMSDALYSSNIYVSVLHAVRFLGSKTATIEFN